MFCKYCGQENSNNATFCKNCGRMIRISFLSRVTQYFQKYWKGIIAIFGIIILLTIIVGSFETLSSTKQNISLKQSSEKHVLTQDEIAAAVVNIICSSSGGEEINGGSGIIIAEEGGILTNYHVVTNAEFCLITLPDTKTGMPREIYVAIPIIAPWLSREYDLAFLKITKAFTDNEGKTYGIFPKQFRTVKETFCSNYIPRLGDEIKIYGYPVTSGGYILTITDGIISSFSGDGLILTSAKVDSGNSGGLAITKDGCFVGIPSAILTGRYQNLGVIIPLNTILEFADQIK